MERLNIVFTNMKNKEIICDDKIIQKKFNSKTHIPTDTFTLKLKLNSNSLHFNNNNIKIDDFLDKKRTETQHIKIII